MPSRRGVSLLLVWGSFYQQLAWAPVLVVLATLAGDPGILAVAASAYSFANMFGNLSFGVLADRYGRYVVAGLGFVAMAATTALHLAATTPALLVVVRLLQGLAAAAVAPAAFAALAEGIPPNRRAETMARAGLFIALASMMAPPVTGVVESRFGIATAVWTLAAGLLAIGVVSLAASKNDPRQSGKDAGSAATGRQAPAHGVAGAGGDTGDAVFNPRLIAASAVAGFSVMFAQNVLFYAFPIKGDVLGFKTSVIGALFSAFAVGAVIAFVPPISKLADRYGRKLPLVAGLVIASAGLAALGVFSTIPAIAAGMLVYGLGFGMIFPAVSALNADGASPARRGAAFGMLTAAFSLGAIVGPLLTQALSGALSPFVTAALLVLVTAGAVSPMLVQESRARLAA